MNSEEWAATDPEAGAKWRAAFPERVRMEAYEKARLLGMDHEAATEYAKQTAAYVRGHRP